MQKNRVDLSSISEVRNYITEWPRFLAHPVYLTSVQQTLLKHTVQKLKNITLKESDILPVELSAVEFSPVLKNYAAVALNDDKGHGSPNGRSPCTAKHRKCHIHTKTTSSIFLTIHTRACMHSVLPVTGH